MNTVHASLAMVAKLTEVQPRIQMIVYFSDGAASQYKNYKNMCNLCHHQQDFNIEAE
jgi:hypothetical protein